MENIWHVQVLVYIILMNSVTYGQDEICIFHGLDADCRYKIEARTISYITGKINLCSDPVSVTFNIKNDILDIDFSHTFEHADSVIMIYGFDVETQLHVKLIRKSDDVLNVEADFYVYGLANADFINQDVDLRGLTESCFTLNEAGKIAVGVMCGLIFVVAVMVGFLLYIRYRRRKREAGTDHDFEYTEHNVSSSVQHQSAEDVNNTAHMTSRLNAVSTGTCNSDTGHVTSGHVTSVYNATHDRTLDQSNCLYDPTVNNATSSINRANITHDTNSDRPSSRTNRSHGHATDHVTSINSQLGDVNSRNNIETQPEYVERRTGYENNLSRALNDPGTGDDVQTKLANTNQYSYATKGSDPRLFNISAEDLKKSYV